MKRRVICFITSLTLCLGLCPTWALAGQSFKLTSDRSGTAYNNITYSFLFDMGGYTYTVVNETAMVVKSGGSLELMNGTVKSEKGAGVKVETGGGLTVNVPDEGAKSVTVIGSTYGLEISSGTTVKLSDGTFEGRTAAIKADDGNFKDLLAIGYSYFDGSGNQLLPEVVSGQKTVQVKECTDHKYSYTANGDTPTHNGICDYCGIEVPNVPCTFNFSGNSSAACEDNCGHTLAITINIEDDSFVDDSIVYDGYAKPKENSVSVTVMLKNSSNKIQLKEDDDYTVTNTTTTDVGNFTVTVSSIPYRWTYTKTFSVTQATPGIEWSSSSKTVDYDGYPVDDLPEVTITAVNEQDKAALEELLYFSYKEENTDDGYINGLPTDVGTYTVKASLPETTNYTAASAELTLTIKKINPFKNAEDIPKANTLTYNGAYQKLVTGGTLDPRAVGAKVLFALGEGTETPDPSDYSETIPTAINAGEYVVYYKVDGTKNYNGASGKIDVTIKRKEITPVVELEYYTTVYSGGFKEPKVTVRDPYTQEVVPNSEYGVTYWDNQYVGTAKVIVSDRTGGNYAIIPPENPEVLPPEGANVPEGVVVEFKITPADQAGLSITGQKSMVTYGDVFTLGTTGGSGNGTVTWEIVSTDSNESNGTESVSAIAKINITSGQVTVTGVGTVTVRATKSDTDSDGNHHDATAEWTFIAGPKSVTATVTAKSRPYNGNDIATVYAVVEQGNLAFPTDVITITGPDGADLTGKFSDANAGTSKTVTLDVGESGAVIVKVNGVELSGAANEKYIVTIPNTTTANITKAETKITSSSIPVATPTYNGTEQALLGSNIAAAPTTTVTNGEAVQVEYALSKNGDYSTDIPKATNAGSYTVWYRVKETDNYFGTTAESVVVTIKPKEVSPKVQLSQSSYTYDGTAKEPSVTVTYQETGEDGEVTIPSTEYTVAYSDNVNAGNAVVKVSARTDGNYTFNTVTVLFSITTGDSAVLTSSPQARDLTYNGQEQELVTVGTASGGHLVYALANTYKDGIPLPNTGTQIPPNEEAYKTELPKGTDAGEYTVYYKVKGDSNHNDSAVACVYVTIQPKTVTSPDITLTLPPDGFMYDGNPKTFAFGETGKADEITVKDGDKTIPTTEYTVAYSNNVNAGTATVHINNRNGGNYNVSGSITFKIKKAPAKWLDVTNPDPGSATTHEPAGRSGLVYNGKAQELITAGVPDGGTAVYAWKEIGPYFTEIPTGTDVGEYKVWAMVRGDANHEDSEPISIGGNEGVIKIAKNNVTKPEVKLSATNFQYNGSEQKPVITVKDDKGVVIAENEYTVAYFLVPDKADNTEAAGIAEVGDDAETEVDPINAGTYKIVITAKENGNYSFTDDTHTFKILPKDQSPLKITGKRDTVYYGDTIQLDTTGGSGNGTVTWSIEEEKGKDETGEYIAIIDNTGRLIVNGVGKIVIKATRKSATGNYADAEDTWEFYANKKPIKATLTGKNKTYDGNNVATVTAEVDSSGLVGGDTITILGLNGEFEDANVGTGKTITKITAPSSVTGKNWEKYNIIYPTTATANITPKEITPTVEVAGTYTYNGMEIKPTVTVSWSDEPLTLQPSDYTITYSNNINAGTATVTVENVPGGNYIIRVTKDFTIEKADQAELTITDIPSGTVYYDENNAENNKIQLGTTGGSGNGTVVWSIEEEIEDEDGTETDKFIAEIDPDTGLLVLKGTGNVVVKAIRTAANYKDAEATWTFTVYPNSSGGETSTQPADGSDTESASTQTSVQDGASSTVINSAAGNELVDEAVASGSENIVIKPEITGDVTKTEVSIPASTVGRIGSETNAALTISTPVADVTIPNESLGMLSGAGGTVSIVTERVDNNTVVLTLTAGGKDVESVPGGLTLTVPVEDAGPGTVAVLVHEDGTRETIRWSVVDGDGIRIPLDGSATVEIVDNSKEFTDVPADNWAAGTVAFASAHELFNGTGKATFSPELSMSRAMLATVLYNLDGHSDLILTDRFRDVDNSTWYAEGVSWAAANGIVSGYGDGQFGPDDSITREQIAVMLWRYAGSPKVDEQVLNFVDADQVSGYAKDAIYWAIANGILNGYGNGYLDPGGLATRAQAAQMLKNFIENT